MSKQIKTHKTVEKFTKDDLDILGRECVYQGFFKMEKIQLRHRLFQGGWTQILTRELFVRGSAVAAVMYDPSNRLIGLIEQFRVGAIDNQTSPWLLEVVAGMTEPEETPEAVILRELWEEAGMVPVELWPICEYLSSPGGTDETLSLYCAIGNLTDANGIYGLDEEGEDIRVVVLPQEQVFSELYSGRYNNAATLICLQWLQLHYQGIIDSYDVST